MKNEIEMNVYMKTFKHDQLMAKALMEGNYRQAIKVSAYRHKAVRKMLMKVLEDNKKENGKEKRSVCISGMPGVPPVSTKKSERKAKAIPVVQEASDRIPEIREIENVSN